MSEGGMGKEVLEWTESFIQTRMDWAMARRAAGAFCRSSKTQATGWSQYESEVLRKANHNIQASNLAALGL